MKKFFCKNPSMFEKEFNSIVEIQGDLKISVLDDGIILPLRKTNLTKSRTYEGGVCDQDFTFVAGFFRIKNNIRINKTIAQAYVPEKKPIKYVDEEVVFAGIYFSHFGHFITDGFSRLWYLKNDSLKGKKIVFVNEPGSKSDWMSVLCCLGFTKDDVIVLHEDDDPIRFRKVHIPEQSFHFFESYHQDMVVPYDIVRKNVARNGSESKKVYLSRTLLKDPDCINEEYFETIYKDLGYEILHLQNMSFSEQVSAMSSAKEIVSTVGTLTHMVLFAEDNVSLVGLQRSNNIPKVQHLIDKARGVEFAYVDVSCNFLPSHHIALVFYIGPNESWRRFFLEKYDKLLSGDIYDYIDRAGHNFGKYLKRWINTSLKKGSFRYLAKTSIYDIVESFERAEHSELDVQVAARREISDLDGLGKKLLKKKFNFFISRDGSMFNFDRTFEFSNGNQLNTIAGKPNNNEAYWEIVDGGLKIMSLKEKVTHEYFEPKISDGKLFFSGTFKNNPFILFRLEEVLGCESS